MRSAVLLAVALAACASPASSPARPPAQPAATGPSSTGPLTEAEFKALHAPPTAGPAVRKGQLIDLAGGKAYLSMPPGEGPFPAIVVIHEWWGLNANIEHWADRLATSRAGRRSRSISTAARSRPRPTRRWRR